MLGRLVAAFDRNVIDGAVNGIGALCMRGGTALRRSANGQAQSYALAMAAAVVLLVVFLLWAERSSGLPQAVVLNTLSLRTGGAR